MAPIDVYTMTAISIAMINFMKTIPACISPGTGKNGSTVAVSSHLSCPPVQYQPEKVSLKTYELIGGPGEGIDKLGLLRPPKFTAYTAANIYFIFEPPQKFGKGFNFSI